MLVGSDHADAGVTRRAPTLSTCSAQRLDPGLTILRIVLGIVFVMHGGLELFGFGPDGVAGRAIAA